MATLVKTNTLKNHRGMVTKHGGPDVLQWVEENLTERKTDKVRMKSFLSQRHETL